MILVSPPPAKEDAMGEGAEIDCAEVRAGRPKTGPRMKATENDRTIFNGTAPEKHQHGRCMAGAKRGPQLESLQNAS